MSEEISKQEKEQLVVQYVSNQDHKLKEKIVAAYQPLVEYIARKLTYQRDDLPDLVQVGTIGLLKSLDKFKTDRKVAFSTFASSNIIGEIRHYLRDKSRIVKLPRRIQEQNSKIRRFIKKHSQELGRFPTPKEIAEALDISIEDVLETMEAGQNSQVISLDKPMYQGHSGSSDEQSSLLESIGIESKDDVVISRESINQAISMLSDRGKQIIHLRFYEGLTQREIAHRLNLSQMHISRLLNEAIDKLQHTLSQHN